MCAAHVVDACNALVVVVVNLASRLPQFLGSASSAPEGLGSQIGANLVRD